METILEAQPEKSADSVTFPKSYAVYDFETTGLDMNTCDVTEIGLMVIREGIVETAKSWLIKIGCPVPEIITQITGITDELLNTEGVEEAKAFQEFAELAKGLPLVGHNIIRYDNPILRRKAGAYGLFESLEEGMKNCVDTAALFKIRQLGRLPNEAESFQDFCGRVLEEKVTGRYNLSYVYESLGLSKEGITAHRAAGDVKMVSDIYGPLTCSYGHASSRIVEKK